MAGIIFLTALIPLAFAFSDTQPIITWSSHRSNLLDLLPFELSPSASLLDRILLHEDICDYDAVVLIEQSGLRASDLRTLNPSSNLAKVLESVPSSRQFPYVSQGASYSFAKAAQSLTSRCGSKVLTATSGEGEIAMEVDSKYVVYINVPQLEGLAKHRKEAMTKYESHLFDDLEIITSLSPKHLVIFTGLPSHLSARQAPTLDLPSSASISAMASAPTSKGDGILKRYQILTPALITTLLITFFILVPIIMFGVSALASIQSPLSSEVPKGFDAQEKKIQ